MAPLLPPRQRGVSMIEALVSFLILSIGLLAFVRVQGELRFTADISRQRAEATRLAEEHMEELRSFATLSAFNSRFSSSADPVTTTSTVYDPDADPATTKKFNTKFTVTRTTRASSTPDYRALAVTVNWTDRRGEARDVLLTTAVARIDPAQQGLLAIPPAATPVKTPYERNVRIPIQAVNLSKTESGFAPPGQSNFFWVFNSSTAAIIKRCTFPSGTTTLAKDDTNHAYRDATCTERPGYLIKGYVRFDGSTSPDFVQPAGNACRFYNRVLDPKKETANDTCPSSPLDFLDVRLSADAGYSPDGILPRFECHDDFPQAAASASRHVNYYCAVYVRQAGDPWEGKVRLVPKTSTPQWSFAMETPKDTFTALGCRYSDDYNKNGSIDAPEHPHHYADVRETLTGQNFVIIRGDKKCKVPATVTIGNTTDTVSYRTCRLEPLPSTDKDKKRCDE